MRLAKKTSLFLATRSIGLFVVFLITAATGAEIKVLSTTAVQEVASDLAAKFEQTTGHRVIFVFEPTGVMLKRIASGETGDIIFFPAQEIDKLVKEGKAAADAVSPFARSSVGVAVRKGTPKPDISSPEAFKQAMMTAKSIVIADPARGGLSTLHILKVFERLGITDSIKHKLVYKKVAGATGNAQAMVESDANIGVGQLSEFAPVLAMEIVGPLPGDLNMRSLFSAVVMRGANDVAAARALLDFMRTPEAATAIKAQGLEPAFP
jgi:molybdate transport system substrate-binding protein